MSSRYLFRCVLFLLFIALLAAVLPYWWLSINTQFRLIDDYTDWNFANKNIRELFWNYVSYFGAGRYRAVHDIGQIFCWRSFGANYHLHHLFRVFLKVSTFAFIYAASLSVIARARKEVALEARLALLVYAFALFFYFPNNPEARLAPAELSTGLALSAFIYFINSTSINKTLRAALLFISFVIFLHSKEPNIVVAPLLIAWVAVAGYPGRLKPVLLKIVPYALLYIHCFFKVLYASRSGYGTGSIMPHTLLENLRKIPAAVFQTNTSWLTAAILALPLLILAFYIICRMAKEYKISRSFSHFTVNQAGLFLTAALLLISFCMGYGFALRYTYPLGVGILIANIIGVATFMSLVPPAGKKTLFCMGTAAALMACYYAAANYSSMALAFKMQYIVAKNENRALKGLEDKIGEHGFTGTAGIRVRDEYDDKIAVYFTAFLPHFYNRHLPFLQINDDDSTSVPPVDYQLLRVPRIPGYRCIETYRPEPLGAVYNLSDAISKSVLHVKHVPAIIDAGADEMFTWHIHEKNSRR